MARYGACMMGLECSVGFLITLLVVGSCLAYTKHQKELINNLLITIYDINSYKVGVAGRLRNKYALR